MTRLFLDASEIAMPPSPHCTLAQLLQYVEHAYLAPYTAIKTVRIDGQPLIVGELLEGQGTFLVRVDQSEKIEITTATVHEIAAEAIHEAAAYLERIESAIPSLARTFRSGLSPSGMNSLKQLYEGIYWISLLLDRLAGSFHSALDSVTVGGLVPHQHYLRMASVLKLMIEYQEKGDYPGMADLLESEVSPSAPVWRELFRQTAARIAAGGDPSADQQESDMGCVKNLTPD